MDLPPELIYKVLADTDLNYLQNVCMADQRYYQICNSSSFWRYKFRQENLPLIREGNSLSSWIHEYEHVKDSLAKLDYTLSHLPELLDHYRPYIYIMMNQMSPVEIFPEYVDRELLKLFLDMDKEGYGQTLLDPVNHILIYEIVPVDGEPTTNAVQLTPPQMEYLLFLIYYYDLKPYNTNMRYL